MFQCAFGLSRAFENNTCLVLDRSFLDIYPKNESYTFRKFELINFTLLPEIRFIHWPQWFKLRSRVLHDGFAKIYRQFYRLQYLVENESKQHDFYINAGNNIYYNGFWQNPSYFKGNREQINSAFKIKTNLITYECKEVLDKISIKNSVSIHIRGGDYLNELNTNRFGKVTLNYYRKACTYLLERFEDLTFNVFSNDVSLAHKLINEIGVKANLVDINSKGNAVLDLLLMRSCNHNIIANSTFSWWAAYLNEWENKAVIAPKNWFGDQPSRSEKIVEKNWVRI